MEKREKEKKKKEKNKRVKAYNSNFCSFN